MRSIIWAPRALASFKHACSYLERERRDSGARLEQEVVLALRHIGNLPLAGRSIFVGDLRAWSLTKWKKILIYETDDNYVKVVAFRDTRQETPRR